MIKHQNEWDIKFEKQILEKFEKVGWDCNMYSEKLIISDRHHMYPDITLSKDNHIYGFVECYRKYIFPEKREQILFLIDRYKPELFILTDGINYEVYFDSKYVGTMTVPLGYNEFSQKTKIFTYTQELKRINDAKNNA